MGKGTHVSSRPFKEEGKGQGWVSAKRPAHGEGPRTPQRVLGLLGSGCVRQVPSNKQAGAGPSLLVAAQLSGASGLHAPWSV